MTPSLTIAQEWELFAKMVVPPGATPTQISETKKAFYAGYTAAILTVLESFRSGTTPEEAGAALVARMVEAQEFTEGQIKDILGQRFSQN